MIKGIFIGRKKVVDRNLVIKMMGIYYRMSMCGTEKSMEMELFWMKNDGKRTFIEKAVFVNFVAFAKC